MPCEIVSPWIKEMDDRPIGEPLATEERTDIVIIGGGIAGTSTAYYLLQESDLHVTLVERTKVGYGASGRNGGQGIASVERSFKDLLGSLPGAEIASLLNEISSGHQRVDEICNSIGYHDGLFKTTIWTGLSSVTEVQKQLEEMKLRLLYGAPVHPLILDEDLVPKVEIDPVLAEMVSTATPSRLKEVLCTREKYIAAYSAPASLANSGRLSRAIARHLLDRYPGRFVLHEESPVSSISFGEEVKARSNGTAVSADAAVLCTNGYPLPELESSTVPKISDSLRRYVASMVAHTSEDRTAPGAFTYFHEEGDPEEEPYFYLTRRPFLLNGNDLVTVGGPQQTISEELDHGAEYPPGVYARIDGFLARSYTCALRDEDMMCWNGPMGYTKDGIRLVGKDPHVPGLWYNTACNGIGFLPSIVGGRKVAAEIAGARSR
ncbi:MAG: D-amino acid dehydrogenase small subunit [Methanomassiliicoccales archaeon PtaU1.Bin030]|nr:MAG: D-amino acid dehydrogenase small subunit [Methanomassiliicoccales archaeon PtaU1.Bin030]